MTTIDAAAAKRAGRLVTQAVLATVVSLGLCGCESTGNSLISFTPDGVTPPSAGTQDPATQTAKIAVAPIIGAPEAVSKQLQAQLGTSIEKHSITVAKAPSEKAEYIVRGYVVSAREKSGTKVSYIWDVFDPPGKRVHRVTGEEVITGAAGKDPWAAVTPQIIDTISTKTAGQIATWLPTQTPAAVASAGGATPPTQTAPGQAPAASNSQTAGGAAQPPQAQAQQQALAPPATTPPPAQQKAKPAAAGAAPAGPTTGSIERGPVNAMVPSVVGAPGDGSVALTGAMQRELTRSGIQLTDKPSGQTYRVEGKVIVGDGKDGKQPIQIDWVVKDPQGANLGTVSQKNEIPQGSLDGTWGKTADAAAAPAAQKVMQLLPPQTRTN